MSHVIMISLKDREQHERLKQYARRENKSVSSYIRTAVAEHEAREATRQQAVADHLTQHEA